MAVKTESCIPDRRRGATWRLARVVLLLAVLPCAAMSSAQTPARAQPPAEYIVGATDVLMVTVFNQPQLTGKYLVQADGTITFPLLERVRVGGLNMQAIEDTLRDGLAKRFLKNPQVGVSVEQYRSQQILIMGEVRQPGTLEFTGSMTLLAALARAGSTTDRAGEEVTVLRPTGSAAAPIGSQADVTRAVESKQAQVLRVDLARLQSGTLTENLVLRGGDTVMVPKVDTVFVSGHVVSGGEIPIRKGMTVRQVLSLAGGITDRGSERRIQIIRTVNGQERKIDAKVQDTVQPNDTIVVRERLL
jgi:polysaccharide export outer membrane protein